MDDREKKHKYLLTYQGISNRHHLITMRNDTLPKINDASVWRAVEEHELTHSAAHYLTSILHLRNQQGYARVTDVAEYLRISRGAASKALSALKERDWVREDRNRMLELTDEGYELARSVERRFLVTESFLEEVLGVPQDVARMDACKIEHMLSPQTMRAFLLLLRLLKKDKPLFKRIQKSLKNLHLNCDDDTRCPICSVYDGCIAEDSGAELKQLQKRH